MSDRTIIRLLRAAAVIGGHVGSDRIDHHRCHRACWNLVVGTPCLHHDVLGLLRRLCLAGDPPATPQRGGVDDGGARVLRWPLHRRHRGRRVGRRRPDPGFGRPRTRNSGRSTVRSGVDPDVLGARRERRLPQPLHSWSAAVSRREVFFASLALGWLAHRRLDGRRGSRLHMGFSPGDTGWIQLVVATPRV